MGIAEFIIGRAFARPVGSPIALNADLIFEIADLPAEGRLRRAKPSLGRERKAARLGDRDEIAKLP
jgi:hypothetical protein